MTEKDIDEITVSELAREADINRKTFYNYYSGVYQVIEEIEHDIITSYERLLGNIEFERDMNTPYILFERFSMLINMDPEFFGYMLTMNGNLSLITRIMTLLKDKTREAMAAQLGLDIDRADVMIDYALSGMLSVYQHWFASDRRMPLEEVSKLISIMTFNGINGAVNGE